MGYQNIQLEGKTNPYWVLVIRLCYITLYTIQGDVHRIRVGLWHIFFTFGWVCCCTHPKEMKICSTDYLNIPPCWLNTSWLLNYMREFSPPCSLITSCSLNYFERIFLPVCLLDVFS